MDREDFNKHLVNALRPPKVLLVQRKDYISVLKILVRVVAFIFVVVDLMKVGRSALAGVGSCL